jgi:hypothetical protein
MGGGQWRKPKAAAATSKMLFVFMGYNARALNRS